MLPLPRPYRGRATARTPGPAVLRCCTVEAARTAGCCQCRADSAQCTAHNAQAVSHACCPVAAGMCACVIYYVFQNSARLLRGCLRAGVRGPIPLLCQGYSHALFSRALFSQGYCGRLSHRALTRGPACAKGYEGEYVSYTGRRPAICWLPRPRRYI